jgi:hypothetical protein
MAWRFRKKINTIPVVHINVNKSSCTSCVGIRESILLAQQQRKNLHYDLHSVKNAIVGAKIKLIMSFVFLYGYIVKKLPLGIKAAIDSQERTLRQLEKQIENCFVKVDIEFDEDIKQQHQQLVDAFKQLSTCTKIWDVTNPDFQENLVKNSSALPEHNRLEVKFMLKSFALIKADVEVLFFENTSGADLYVYPSFILLFSSCTNFAVIGLNEIVIQNRPISSIEKYNTLIDPMPDQTDNKRPILEYAALQLFTSKGLDKYYVFSKAECTATFAREFKAYQKLINN